jgi:hypothetical protein
VSSRILRACVVLAAASACAKAPAPAAPSPEPGVIVTSQGQTQAPINRNRDVITKEEMQGASMGSQSVLDVVTALRPNFLTVRGLHTVPVKDANGNQVVDEESGKVHASIDGNRVVALDELRSIQASTVVEIRFLNPSAAMQKFGGAAREGPVILVKTM